MKVPLIDKSGKEKEKIDLPKNFDVDVRQDIIAKAYEALKHSEMSPYGSKKGAGAGYSASGIVRHKRHAWKTAYGRGISRIPRKILSRNGASFNWVGATVSNTRGGRRPHAPRPEKVLSKKINKKEKGIAFDSALSASLDEKWLEKRYHRNIGPGAVFTSDITTLKTKEFFEVLKNVFKSDLEKIQKKKSVRSGKGKLRGRKYKSNAGLLFVVASDEKMNRNKITTVRVNDLSLSDLAPNAEPGRLTCYTEKAINEIGGRFK